MLVLSDTHNYSSSFDELGDFVKFDEEMAHDEVIPESIMKAFPTVDDILSWDASAIINWANLILPDQITESDRRTLEQNNFDGYGFLGGFWPRKLDISNVAKCHLMNLSNDIQSMSYKCCFWNIN